MPRSCCRDGEAARLALRLALLLSLLLLLLPPLLLPVLLLLLLLSPPPPPLPRGRARRALNAVTVASAGSPTMSDSSFARHASGEMPRRTPS
jgi:hypothetical protein